MQNEQSLPEESSKGSNPSPSPTSVVHSPKQKSDVVAPSHSTDSSEISEELRIIVELQKATLEVQKHTNDIREKELDVQRYDITERNQTEREQIAASERMHAKDTEVIQGMVKLDERKFFTKVKIVIAGIVSVLLLSGVGIYLGYSAIVFAILDRLLFLTVGTLLGWLLKKDKKS